LEDNILLPIVFSKKRGQGMEEKVKDCFLKAAYRF